MISILHSSKIISNYLHGFISLIQYFDEVFLWVSRTQPSSSTYQSSRKEMNTLESISVITYLLKILLSNFVFRFVVDLNDIKERTIVSLEVSYVCPRVWVYSAVWLPSLQ